MTTGCIPTAFLVLLVLLVGVLAIVVLSGPIDPQVTP